MKGVIFNLLERAVSEEYGEDTWDDLVDEAGVSGSYTSLGNYSDAEIEALIAAASLKTGLDRAQILRWFGERALPMLREAYPALFADHQSSRDFVLSVNEKIHPEVRKLYPEASCPFFHIRTASGADVRLDYQSPRDMADLAHGFVIAAAKLYEDQVDVTLSASEAAGKIDQLHLRYAGH